MDFKEKKDRLKKIIEKNDINFFWKAFDFFIDKAGYKEEMAFTECIFYFGEDAMFEDVDFIDAWEYSKDVIHFYVYFNPKYPENLNNFTEFCVKNNLNLTTYGIDMEELLVKITSQPILEYIKKIHKKVKGEPFPEPQPTKSFNGVGDFGGEETTDINFPELGEVMRLFINGNRQEW